MGVPGGLPGDTRKLCGCGGVIHIFSSLTMVMVLWIYTYVKAHSVHFQYVQFTVYNNYISIQLFFLKK